MALALTSGGESRLDGAPDQMLPPYEDSVEALAQALLAEDEDGVYGGDINMAREAARMQLGEMNARSVASRQAAAASGAERNRMRAERQGVVPESLPMDEYGAVSGRTVQEANRPLEDAEAALAMEQEAADGIIRGMREGQRNWEAEGDYTYLQERGERFPNAAPGERDMDYRNRIRQRRGQTFYTSDGTAIPVGREPTPQEVEAERKWYEWANQTPGSERQALYDPQAYEAHREGVREGIRNRAQWEELTFGTGPDRKATPLQQQNRQARRAAEERVRTAQRGRFYEQKLQNETGMPAGTPIEVMEAERFRQRDAARSADLASRRDNLRNQRLLMAPGAKGVANAINMLPPGWREVAILDRLTEGRVGGPTPLGVEALGAQNALRFMNNEAMAGMDPLRRQAAQDQMDMQRRQQVPELAGQQDIAAGNSQTPEARDHLEGLAERHDTTAGGFSYQDEARLAETLQRPPYNMPQAEAEALAYDLAQERRWISGARPEERSPPPAGQSPARPRPQQPADQPPPVRRTPQGGGRGGRTAQPPNAFGGPRGGRGTGSRLPRR